MRVSLKKRIFTPTGRRKKQAELGEKLKKSNKKRMNHLLQYADQMRYGKIVREYLGTDE